MVKTEIRPVAAATLAESRDPRSGGRVVVDGGKVTEVTRDEATARAAAAQTADETAAKKAAELAGKESARMAKQTETAPGGGSADQSAG